VGFGQSGQQKDTPNIGIRMKERGLPGRIVLDYSPGNWLAGDRITYQALDNPGWYGPVRRACRGEVDGRACPPECEENAPEEEGENDGEA